MRDECNWPFAAPSRLVRRFAVPWTHHPESRRYFALARGENHEGEIHRFRLRTCRHFGIAGCITTATETTATHTTNNESHARTFQNVQSSGTLHERVVLRNRGRRIPTRSLVIRTDRSGSRVVSQLTHATTAIRGAHAARVLRVRRPAEPILDAFPIRLRGPRTFPGVLRRPAFPFSARTTISASVSCAID